MQITAGGPSRVRWLVWGSQNSLILWLKASNNRAQSGNRWRSWIWNNFVFLYFSCHAIFLTSTILRRFRITSKTKATRCNFNVHTNWETVERSLNISEKILRIRWSDHPLSTTATCALGGALYSTIYLVSTVSFPCSYSGRHFAVHGARLTF